MKCVLGWISIHRQKERLMVPADACLRHFLDEGADKVYALSVLKEAIRRYPTVFPIEVMEEVILQLFEDGLVYQNVQGDPEQALAIDLKTIRNTVSWAFVPFKLR